MFDPARLRSCRYCLTMSRARSTRSQSCKRQPPRLDSTEANRASTIRHAKPWYRHLSVQILLGMVLGILVGHLWPESADSWKPLGDLFIKLVRMLVAPIIFCTVVHGIASVGEAKKVGRVAIKSLIYFEVVTTIALVLALLLVNLWAPGAGMHVDLKSLADPTVKAPAKPVAFGQFLLNLVPASAIGAFAEGESFQYCSSHCYLPSVCWLSARKESLSSTAFIRSRRYCSR